MSVTLQVDNRGVITVCASCGTKNRLPYDLLSASTRCAKCRAPLSSPSVPVEVASTEQFDSLIEKSALPVLVDFWAQWCGPCHMVAPHIDEVARKRAGSLLVAKVDTDRVQEVAARLGIRSIPLLAVFTGGREAARQPGAMGSDRIEAFVQEAVRPST